MRTQFAKVQTLTTALNSLVTSELHSAVAQLLPQLIQDINDLGTKIEEHLDSEKECKTCALKLAESIKDHSEALKRAKLVASELCKGEPVKLDNDSNIIEDQNGGVIAEPGVVDAK